MHNSSSETTLAQQLIDRHFHIWNDPNPTSRATKFAAVYAPDIFVADHGGKAEGYQNVNSLIERVQTQHTGFLFSPEPISWNHGLGRVRWGYGPKNNADLVRGEDIFIVRDGKLAGMHVFLDN